MLRLFSLSLLIAIAAAHTQVAAQSPQTSTAANPSVAADAITKQSLQELGQIVERYIANEQAVGAELHIIQNGQTVYHESFGFSDRDDQRQWENGTICNIRSMTKPITSAAAQILIDRNLMNLDDPVAKYLDSFDNDKSKAITVRQVLTHRSGLPLTNLQYPYQFSNLTEQVAAAGKQGPQFEPGSKFWYSDLGTDVVGAVVEKVSGEPLHEFVLREILDPLGMSSTFYGIDAADQRLSQAASLYLKVPKGWFRFWKPDVKPLYPFAWGSQTVYSTTTDYAKFLEMLMHGGRAGDRQLLSAAAVSRMLQPVSRTKMMGSDTPAPTGFHSLEAHYGQMMVNYYELGKEKGNPVVIGHSGSDGTCAWAWPERDLMIMYFTQSRGGMTPLRIEESIDRWIIHQGQELAEDVPPSLRPYLGTYVANYDSFENEEFTVKVKNGKLVLDVPSQMPFELKDPDAEGYWPFALVPDQVQATFDRNENDEVVGLRLHKGGEVYEVPRRGTARAEELSQKKMGRKAAARERKSTERLKEAWVGQVDMGGIEPVMQFRIVRLESGETAAYFDSVTEGRTGFDATWSIEGDQLKFDVAKIKLTYRGTLNEAGDAADGTWSQGGRALPLTLKKQDKEHGADDQSR
jgi:CubicO group peptidase (beta-lactamase class C family)